MAVKVKICGMKYPENISEIASIKPDYLGFIFYDKSPRYFENSIPNLDKSIKKVGVFVDATYEEIKDKVKQHELDLVQLHGNESPGFCALVEINLSKVIKSFSIDNEFEFNVLNEYKNYCSYFLFDTKGLNYGGNGIAFDWKLLKQYKLEKPYFLSGGIGPDDTEEIKSFLKNSYAEKCHAVDLNSRFEIEPGIKSPKTLKTFITNLKETS